MPWRSSMDTYINSQVGFWKTQKKQVELPEKKHPPFITISREYGCGGYEVALKLIEMLNEEFNPAHKWAAYDKKLLQDVMDDLGLTQHLAETLTHDARNKITNLIQTSFSKFPNQVAVYKKLVHTIGMLAINGNVVIVGRGGNIITRKLHSGYHVRLVATHEWRVQRVAEIMKISHAEAKKVIDVKSKERHHFVKEFVKHDLSDPHSYHLVINNAFHNAEESAKMIIQGMKFKELL